jgi:hypothetical protein
MCAQPQKMFHTVHLPLQLCCRGVFLYECVPLWEGAPKRVSPRVFPNLRRMHKY